VLALARKYRPKTFADVAVQSHVSTTLKGAIARGRVAHGYLLCGPRGVGKTTLARVLAMALNCERHLESGEPCGECGSCRRIWSGAASLDVVEIDAASNRGVDDARDLRERAMYAPSGDRQYKVYIVDEAHMLTREAWNALLKILEEPPPRVVFVFATTEPQKIAQSAAPVLSRLQRFDFKRIGPAEIRERLSHVLSSEGISAEAEALAALARAADGSMRDALSLADQVLAMGDGRVTAARVREALGLIPEDEYLAVLDLIADRRAADVFPVVARLAESGIDFGGFLVGLAEMIRAQLAVALGGTTGDLSDRARDALIAGRDRFAAADLLRMLSVIGELEPRFRRSGQQQLLVEILLVRFALLDRSIEIEDILRSLGGQGAPPAGGGRGAARSERHAPAAAGPSGMRSESATEARNAPSTDARSEGSGAARSMDAASGRAMSAAPAAASLRADSMRESLREPPPDRARVETIVDGGSALRVQAPARSAPLDLNQVVGQWEVVAERLRAAGKPLLATALEHSSPVAVTARGDVTIELNEPNDFFERAVVDGARDVVAALREWFAGVERVQLRRDERVASAPRRLTDEMVRAERLASLGKRDPVLRAAIDALDLDVAD
jgi:DNA polymerase III subunit gamma/tau